MPASWWQQTFNFARQILALKKDSEQHDIEIKELRREVKDLSATVQELIYEMRHDREKTQYERQLAEKDWELLLSRLEVRLLRHERGLPPPTSGTAEDDVA